MMSEVHNEKSLRNGKNNEKRKKKTEGEGDKIEKKCHKKQKDK